MHWYVDVLKKYVVFDGRARRQEYWMFFLFNFLAACVCMLLDNILGLNKATNGLNPLQSLYALAVFLPGLGVTVRRLHDTGRSGWWFLIAFIPCIGGIVLLVWLVTDSEPGSNAYGPNPKGMSDG